MALGRAKLSPHPSELLGIVSMRSIILWENVSKPPRTFLLYNCCLSLSLSFLFYSWLTKT